MNAFDDTLKALDHAGQVLLAETYCAPWAIRIPDATRLRRALAQSGNARIVPFHFVRRGGFQLKIADKPPLTVREGEVAILFGGQEHVMYERSALAPVEFAEILAGTAAPEPACGETGTELICGVFVMNHARGNPMLQALPPLMCADMSGRGGGRALDMLGGLLTQEIGTHRAGSDYMIGRLLQMICAEAIRAQLEQDFGREPNWFAGLKDLRIGRALNLIHADPAAPLSVTELARHAGMSNSRFAARFREKMGVSPMRYLASWRMDLAARHLSTRDDPVSKVAHMVGYENLPAFNRAFRRAYGCPPGTWRAHYSPAIEPTDGAQLAC